MASTYVAPGEREYGRYGNPTWQAFEDALGALEGGRCLAFSSGLAAVATVLDLVGHGARWWRRGTPTPAPCSSSPTSRPAAGSPRELVDITDTDAVAAACEDAALVWFESPTNPALEVADIARHHAPPRTPPAPTSWSTTPSPPRILQRPLSRRRRHRRALRHQVHRGPQRRPDGGGRRPATTSCTPC